MGVVLCREGGKAAKGSSTKSASGGSLCRELQGLSHTYRNLLIINRVLWNIPTCRLGVSQGNLADEERGTARINGNVGVGLYPEA